MDTHIHVSKRSLRMGIAGLATLVVGAAWGGVAAQPGTAAQAAPASAPQISRAIATGHDSYADIVKVVAPAVVTIRIEGKARITQLDPNPFGRGPRQPQQRTGGLGSGVIVGTDGYLLTNNHVVDGAQSIKVELTDGRSFTANVVGTDKPSDLALLKIDATGLPALALGNSDAMQVGDIVLAVGNPLGIGQTVTMGIISAKGRQTDFGGGSYEEFLQTDAPINHGNSGGALVSTKGELIGINSQIASVSDGNIGIGFAIPANMARRIMDDLRSDGKVRRARLGVTIQPVTSEMAESLGLKATGGAIVSSVEAGSAADRAGIERNDIIKSFNGQPVDDTNALRNRVAEAKPGSSATVIVDRNGSERTLTVTLGEAEASASAAGGARARRQP